MALGVKRHGTCIGAVQRLIIAPLALSTACVKFASEFDEGPAQSLESSRAADSADWSCLGRSEPVAQAARDPAELTYSPSVEDFVTEAPVAARVRACFRADLGCVSPALDGIATDPNGRFRVTAPADFDGYLEVEAEGMVPTLVFFVRPWSEALLEALEPSPIRLLPASIVEANASLAVPLSDEMSGGIGVFVRDCDGEAAAAVRLEIDTDGVPFAIVNGLPATGAVTTIATTDDGIAGFGQVPAGVVSLRGFVAGREEPLVTQSLLVRPEWLTILDLVPDLAR